jgi:phosphate transport system regulatory protein PhoU
MMTRLLGLLGTFDPVLASQFAVQILLALFLGGVIGFERERQRMPAGVRTFMLVSVGSCLFTILSYRGFLGGDPGRVAAQIVSGIGFLGAGVTIQRKGTIYGLTSAAGIWAVAAIGMAVGTGNYFLAVFSTVAVFVVMGLLRRWSKADIALSTRHTLNTALRQVRRRIATMGDLVERALKGAIQAMIEDDHNLALQIVEEDERINDLRYGVEEECLDILRRHHPAKIQLRTVLAAAHIATNLERIGDYAKEIARIRLQIGHEALLEPMVKTPAMVEQVCDLLQQILIAFAKDDVKAAQRIREQVTILDRDYEDIVEAVTQKMSEKKTRHFERGAYLLNIAYYMRRAGERVINIAERIIFVRTGALAELDRDD